MMTQPLETMELTREVTIRMIHHLWNPAMSDEENHRSYGICVGQHGHNIKVRVTVAGVLNESSGLIIDRDRLDEILLKTIVTPYDGTDLNDHFANTAGEALAESFFKILAPEFSPGILRRVAIWEARMSHYEYAAPAL